MPDPTITYFPVGNGDTSLIKFSDKTTFIIDLNVTEANDDEEETNRYDIHTHLLKEVRKDEKEHPHTDGFLLTHPDQDHIRGFPKVFYTGNPTKYSENDEKEGRIIIDEMWFAPRIFWEGRDLSDDAKAFKKEVNRRIALYKNGGDERNLAGNRIRIIGYSDNPSLEGLEDIVTVPGSTINLINGSNKEDFHFFVHAPLKKETDADWEEHNRTSIILQGRFSVDGEEEAALVFWGGDAGCPIWEEIIEKSDDTYLQWDLLLAPHHCSWSFFSELPSDDEKPSDNILAFLKNSKRTGAYVISSSKPIKNDDDNPPHYSAAQRYKEKVGNEHFLCTGEHPKEKKTEPIYFRMTKNGPQKDEYSKAGQILSSAALKATVTNPKTYGREF